MAKIELERLHKSYDQVKILNDISLTVNEGEFTALLGNSGSGKTTILHAIAGINDMDQGVIKINDINVTHTPINERHAVLVDQNLLLFPHMTVEANIGFGLRMRKVKTGTIKKKTYELLELLELVGHEKKYPNQLSGGQMQRVAIARALATEPYVLLLDEPFSKLDISLRASMQKFVSKLQKKLGMTTILVTHDKDEALSMADRVAILAHGEIIQYGEPNEVYEHPKTMEVSKCFGERNYFEGIVKNHTFSCDYGVYPTDTSFSEAVYCMIRPEEIVISKNSDGIDAIVTTSTYKGDQYAYTAEVDGKEIYFYGRENDHYRAGDRIKINIPFLGGVILER